MEKKEDFSLPVFSLRRRFNQVILLVFLILLLAVWGALTTYLSFNSVRELLRADAGAPATAVTIETLQQLSNGLLQALVIGIVIALVLAFIMFTFITAGVRTVALEVWIRRMGAGDLEYKVEIEGNDELAESARALEELRQRSIKAMQLDLVKKLSQDLQDKNEELERVLAELRQTQDQIILRQKLAELGELTAGVAHEIRNPLNFMKNFSEASDELLAELRETIDENAADLDDERRSLISEICEDLAENLQRIRSHGDRANRIVHDMLMLGRGGGRVQMVDINDLLREHALLAFHSARALDPDFLLDIEEELDPDAGQVPVISEDMGRVFLNMVGKRVLRNGRETARPCGQLRFVYANTFDRHRTQRGNRRDSHSRQRHRHPSGRYGESLQPILHDETGRQGHGTSGLVSRTILCGSTAAR